MFIQYSHPAHPVSHQRGFTLIELLIVMIVIAIVSLFASNLLQPLAIRSHFRSTTLSLEHIISQSRNQAISLTARVIICPSNDDRNCHNNWNDSLISFIDRNANNRRDSHELISFRHYNPDTPASDISYTRQVRFLRFDATGRVNSNGSFHICPTGNNDQAQVLVINRQGRVRITRDTNNDGIVEDANGSNVSC